MIKHNNKRTLCNKTDTFGVEHDTEKQANEGRIVRDTQSGPKHRKKSSDLRHRLKAVNDVDEVRYDTTILTCVQRQTGSQLSLPHGTVN